MPRGTGSPELDNYFFHKTGGTLKKTDTIKEISAVARNGIALARYMALGQVINLSICQKLQKKNLAILFLVSAAKNNYLHFGIEKDRLGGVCPTAESINEIEVGQYATKQAG